MFKLGTSEDLWSCREKYPDVFLEQFRKNALKPLGHATVVEFANNWLDQDDGVLRVLEVGHGAVSTFFNLFNAHDQVELHGLDAYDKDKTVAHSGLDRLRLRYSNIQFHDGYLGHPNDLPSDYFDLVFSVSVIEHVPTEQLKMFHDDMFRILRKGGVQMHSYDRPWAGNISLMIEAVESSGFSWLQSPLTAEEIENFWQLSNKQLARVVFEHPFNVMEKFSHSYPREGRKLYNWVTVIMGASKLT